MPETIIKKRACHLCEAVCGVDIHLQDNQIVAIKGDKDDPLSQGHICPKAVALQDIHNDPERLRGPVKRNGKEWQEISWDEAFDLVVSKVAGTIAEHGANAVGVYAGNPSVHNYGSLTHPSQFLGLIRTQNRFSATSVDQLPHQLMAYWLYGHQLMVPIPDIDRCDYFLMLGANPMASNGSIMTVPNFPKRLKALQQRGGKLLVVDPRRTETAERADEHLFVRPGTDAAFLAAIVHVIFRDSLAKPGRAAEFTDQLDQLPALFESFTPESVESITGISAATTERIAKQFCAAERAVCYGRMGCSTQEFGTLCQWLTQIINILTGNLDEPGGMMLTSPAVDMIGGSNGGGFGKPGHFNQHQSRVSGLPEFGGELPASCMAEEITTPGEGQIKLMITSAGNPVLSTPSGHNLATALEQLDFMLSIDLYINETTQYADVILPPTSPLEHDHYDLIFHHFAVRNTSKYSAPVFDKPEGSFHDWEIFTQLGERLGKLLDKKPKPSMPPDQMIELGLQIGQYDLNLDMLKEKPEGIDLGPLQSCMPERLFTENKRINCLPEPMPVELQRLSNKLLDTEDSLLMIGRRHVRNNNSWMHQYHRLIKGANRCTLLINPDDAKRQGVADGDMVTLENDAGSITLPIELSDTMMPGVVCMPHGFGHNAENGRVSTASDNAGVSMNDVIPANAYDPLSGNAAVNGVPISLSRA